MDFDEKKYVLGYHVVSISNFVELQVISIKLQYKRFDPSK